MSSKDDDKYNKEEKHHENKLDSAQQSPDHKKRHRSCSPSPSSPSASSDSEKKRKRRKKDKKKKEKKRDKREKKKEKQERKEKKKVEKEREKKERQQKEEFERDRNAKRPATQVPLLPSIPSQSSHPPTTTPTIPPKRSMGPISDEEHAKIANRIREVYDPESGRTRLVKGEGEIIERIVTRDQHKAINKIATNHPFVPR